MIDKIAPTSTNPIDPSDATRRSGRTDRASGTFRLVMGEGIPFEPPHEVISALDGAARIREELKARGLSVTFDVQPNGSVRVAVVDGKGAVIHSFTPARALEALNGETSIDDLGKFETDDPSPVGSAA